MYITERIAAWDCNTFDQMLIENRCEVPGNPLYFFGTDPQPKKAGILSLPHYTVYSDDPVDVSPTSVIPTPNPTAYGSDDPTIVFFGVNRNHKLLTVAGLLSDDGHVNIQPHIRADGSYEYVVYNPDENEWKPLEKYNLNFETNHDAIITYLNNLPKPMKFVLVLDYSDLFSNAFWNLVKFIILDKIYHTEFEVVEINIPHDSKTLEQHLAEIKNIIRNSDPTGVLGQFSIGGLHVIEQSGRIAEISELSKELSAIKAIVGISINYMGDN